MFLDKHILSIFWGWISEKLYSSLRLKNTMLIQKNIYVSPCHQIISLAHSRIFLCIYDKQVIVQSRKYIAHNFRVFLNSLKHISQGFSATKKDWKCLIGRNFVGQNFRHQMKNSSLMPDEKFHPIKVKVTINEAQMNLPGKQVI